MSVTQSEEMERMLLEQPLQAPPELIAGVFFSCYWPLAGTDGNSIIRGVY